ncbi:hypothetical protein ACTXK0_04710 [Corynebacterium variabile]|uniref:hypothetical protein n=1 Tax=Corynebacterium variabile TaxID=1727 RepID=UPI003FD2167E
MAGEDLEDFDPYEWTKSADDADKGMQVPDGLMGFASDTRGKPPSDQEYLYISALTFAYAVWENYVEDLAVELVNVLSREIRPEKIPEKVYKGFTKQADAWSLLYNPGWKALWVDRVETAARGSGKRNYGMNTANKEQCDHLFSLIGIDPIPVNIKVANTGRVLKPGNIESKGGSVEVEHLLSELILVRGEAVHTAKTTTVLKKREVLWWSNAIRTLYEETDRFARAQVLEYLEDVKK